MKVPRVDLPSQFNVATYLVDRNLKEGRGGKTALLHEGKATSYQDVLQEVNRFGNALRSLNVEMEDRVALLLLDSPEFVAAFFGAIKIGAGPIPMNTMLRPVDYEYMLQDSRAKVLVVHEALWEPLRALRDGEDAVALAHVHRHPGAFQPFRQRLEGHGAGDLHALAGRQGRGRIQVSLALHLVLRMGAAQGVECHVLSGHCLDDVGTGDMHIACFFGH